MLAFFQIQIFPDRLVMRSSRLFKDKNHNFFTDPIQMENAFPQMQKWVKDSLTSFLIGLLAFDDV